MTNEIRYRVSLFTPQIVSSDISIENQETLDDYFLLLWDFSAVRINDPV